MGTKVPLKPTRASWLEVSERLIHVRAWRPLQVVVVDDSFLLESRLRAGVLVRSVFVEEDELELLLVEQLPARYFGDFDDISVARLIRYRSGQSMSSGAIRRGTLVVSLGNARHSLAKSSRRHSSRKKCGSIARPM